MATSMKTGHVHLVDAENLPAPLQTTGIDLQHQNTQRRFSLTALWQRQHERRVDLTGRVLSAFSYVILFVSLHLAVRIFTQLLSSALTF